MKPQAERLPSAELLWDDRNLPVQLGCSICPELGLCGGLRVRAALFDCRILCACRRGRPCNGMCRRNHRAFVARVREIDGFSLDNVRRVAPVPGVRVSQYIPIIYDGTSRSIPLVTDVVAVPLMRLFNRVSGTSRFMTRSGLLRDFGLAETTRIVLTGVADDQAIETWWKFRERPRLLAELKALGISLITVPNYSLFTDVTRHDNLHNIKRIALAWAEIVAAGIPCALHVNARTDMDYHRWLDFIGEREEVTDIAFEFITGAASSRGNYHRDQLVRLAERVGRPLNLYVRGGLRYFGDFGKAFAAVSVLDATPHMKAKYRRRAVSDGAGVRWERSPTDRGVPVDSLLVENISVMGASTMNRVRGART
jgi:hypothetical protein